MGKIEYFSVEEISNHWELSERSVRNYCAEGRVPGAVLDGKTWQIPSTAEKPNRKIRHTKQKPDLLKVLKREKESGLKGGIYHRIQVDLTYNSNHMEGSRLTHEQTRFIFETRTIGITDSPMKVDDLLETVNHFRCIDLVIEGVSSRLTEGFIKQLHFILKTGTSDSSKAWFAVGDYKRYGNEVADIETTAPEDVAGEMKKLLQEYNAKKKITLDDILDFHVQFERIHPFQDGNGRIGRLILFKECLRHHIVPFIITEELKYFYYRGLSLWKRERGLLRDTCLTAQDTMKTQLDKFGIGYNHVAENEESK